MGPGGQQQREGRAWRQRLPCGAGPAQEGNGEGGRGKASGPVMQAAQGWAGAEEGRQRGWAGRLARWKRPAGQNEEGRGENEFPFSFYFLEF